MIVNILIIDSSASNILNIQKMIEELENPENINILTATNSKEAIEISDKNDIHLVILDTDLEDINKFELTKYIKDNNNTPNIPTIFITDEFQAEEYLENGYTLDRINYQLKPIEKYQFLNEVGLCLRHYVSKKELSQHISILSSSIDRALDIHFDELVEIIPIATAIIDNDSIIKYSNTLFEEFSHSVVGGFLGSCFIQNDEYVYDDGILDWKDIAITSEEQTKVLIKMDNEEKEFFIDIKKIKNKELYTVCFHNIEKEV